MTRAEQKAATRQRILETAAARIRSDGLAGNAVQRLMQDVGLTHGGFYVHFDSKEALDVAALRQAMQGTAASTGIPKDIPRAARRKLLANRYLSRSHRDNPETGCALAALLSEAGRAGGLFRDAFEQEFLKAIERRSDGAPDQAHDIALMALAMGGLALARALPDRALSDAVLRACRDAAGALADQYETQTPAETKHD